MTNISRGLILESLLPLVFMFLGWFLFSFLCCVLNVPFYVIVIAYLTSIFMYIIMSTSCTSSKPCISIAHHELIFQNDFYRDVRYQQGYDWMKSLFFLPIFFLPEMQIQFFLHIVKQWGHACQYFHISYRTPARDAQLPISLVEN